VSLVGIAAKRIVTCDPARATADDPLGVVEDGVVLYDEHSISWIGPRADVEDDKCPIVDHGDVVVTPGLVDAHTHAAWLGSRHDEYAMRMAGADYRAIAAAGGGILSTYRAIARAPEKEIAETLRRRLQRMAALGVTTVEVKSGYGLEPDLERKQLRAIAATRSKDLPHVVATFLALHALPESARSRRDHYVLRAATALVPEFAREKLCEFVDAYVDENAFAIEEARLVCDAAKRAGLGVRLHVGQFADIGGAQLCAEVGARSADHLEHVGHDGIVALAGAGVAATLLPTASFTLGQAPPPIEAFRQAGIPMVVASDANPGTSPSESLPLAMALAVRLYGLSPAEALLGATRHAATSLGLAGGVPRARGVLAPGARADVVVWDLPHENAIIQPWGVPRTRVVLRDGARIGGLAP
jgi:imidazolonepropionase